ncbi:MAG: PAS domain S-box protein [Candidatus Hodarchaeota archaeon]
MKSFEQNQGEDFENIYSILNNITEIFIVFNNHLEIQYVNEVIHLKYLGYNRSDLIGKNLKNFVKPDYFNVFYEVLQNALRVGEGTVEFPIRNKKNNYVWLEGKIKVFEDIHNNEKALLICREISKHKAFEKKKEEDAIFYKSLVRTSPNAIILTDLRGRIIELSSRVLEISDYKDPNFLIGKNILSFITPSNRNSVLTDLSKILKEDKVSNIILKFLKNNGSYYKSQFTISVIKDSNIEPKAFLGIFRDITKKSKLEIRLKDSEEKYRHLFETSPFAVILTDKSGYIIDCNSATEILTGYKKSELIGSNYSLISIIHQDYLPALANQRKITLDGEILPPLDIQLYKKDGALIWAEIQSSLVKIGAKKLIQIIGFDITNKRMAEKLVKEEIKKLKDLDKMRKDIISRVSHELKTPIMSISGASELLLTAYKDQVGEDALELIRMIENGGKRLSSLVENLINISRIELNKFFLNKRLTNFNKILRACISELSHQIEERELTLNIDLQDNFDIKLDKLRITQVIMNLLMNAIKNTPPNGEINVVLRKNDNHAEMKIRDTGVGLKEDEMVKIFTRFGKLERYGPGLEYLNIQGSGLGLFISKEIVNLHGGQIWVESEGRHKGATFIVKLPIS